MLARLLAALSCCLLPGLRASPPSLPCVSVRDGRFVDDAGNERHFRGVNVVYKDPPWYPAEEAFHANLSFVEADADLLRSLGVNLIRLGVMWPGVVPARGEINRTYLAAMDRIVELAASRGIYTLVEPHQDEMNPRFCGEGAPDWWAAANTNVTDFPAPVQSTPFELSPPGRHLCDTHSSFSYIWTHDGARAYQTLWENPADFADFWQAVAKHFRGNCAVLAAEVWNEPFPGDVFGKPSVRSNAFADRHNLQPFYEAVEKAIHSDAGDPNMLVAYEPSWPVGDQDLNATSILPATSGFSKLPGASPLYAFHYYVAPCDPNVSAYLDERLADAARLKAAPIATEFNLGASNIADMDNMLKTFEAFEERLISYTGWQYKSYSGSLPMGTCTGCGNSFFDLDGKLNTYVTGAMGRPFAETVAGRVLERTFDPDGGAYTLTFERAAGSGPGTTRINLPGEWTTRIFDTEVIGDDGAKQSTIQWFKKDIAPGVVQLPHRAITLEHPSATLSTRRITVKLTPRGPFAEKPAAFSVHPEDATTLFA